MDHRQSSVTRRSPRVVTCLLEDRRTLNTVASIYLSLFTLLYVIQSGSCRFVPPYSRYPSFPPHIHTDDPLHHASPCRTTVHCKLFSGLRHSPFVRSVSFDTHGSGFHPCPDTHPLSSPRSRSSFLTSPSDVLHLTLRGTPSLTVLKRKSDSRRPSKGVGKDGGVEVW